MLEEFVNGVFSRDKTVLNTQFRVQQKRKTGISVFSREVEFMRWAFNAFFTNGVSILDFERSRNQRQGSQIFQGSEFYEMVLR